MQVNYIWLCYTDGSTAYESFRTISSLLMTNADFRLLVGDLTTVSRQIFADTASSVSAVAAEVSEQIEPPEPAKAAIGGTGSAEEQLPTTSDVVEEAERVVDIAKDGVSKVAEDAIESAQENITGEQKKLLIRRVKRTVDGLRKREDYSNSAGTLAQIVQRYAMIYYRAIGSTVAEVEEDVEVNEELNEAMIKLWAFISSFGNREDWKLLEKKFNSMMKSYQNDEKFRESLTNIGSILFSLLTDPGFYDSIDESFSKLRAKIKEASSDSNQDLIGFYDQLTHTLHSVSRDESMKKLIATTKKIFRHLTAAFNDERTQLPADALHIFLPLLLRAVQHIPIPRLEISVPEMDLLLENVILEPGHTVHSSSFLPYRLNFTAINSFEIRKTHSKETTTDLTTVVNVTMNGLSISAQDFGYWVRVHAPPYLPYFGDQGIASFALDKRGIDISLDIAVGRQRLEQVFSLRGVRVCIHKLDYTVKKSSWSFLWWMVKPFVKHMVRRTLEKKIAEQIVAAARFVNRELVFMRERLRATRIANPDDLVTFVRAVLARMVPAPDPDLYARVGVDAHREGVFEGVYTPASVMKIWHEEGERTDQLIDAGDESGGVGLTWRNRIFNYIPSRHPSQQPSRTV